ncbi:MULTISPECIES: STAS domain-containing protein [Aphanothece]|uniref:STAS domain-containing protein n=1 Tax=Aphanothece TaxID=1121 RepID=UPI003984F321
MSSYYILSPRGFIDAQNGSDLRDRIISILVEQPRDVVIDCKDVEFMDSSGFGCLVSALKRVREQGHQLCLSGINSQLRAVFELTGTDRVFPIFPTLDDALAHLS